MNRDGKVIVFAIAICVLVISVTTFVITFTLGYPHKIASREYPYTIETHVVSDANGTLPDLEVKYYIPIGAPYNEYPAIYFFHGDNNIIADKNMLKNLVKSGMACADFDYKRKIQINTTDENEFYLQVYEYSKYIYQIKNNLPYSTMRKLDYFNEYYFGDGYGALAVMLAASKNNYSKNMILQNPDYRLFEKVLNDSDFDSLQKFLGRNALILQGNKCKGSSVEKSQALVDYLNKDKDRAKMIIYDNQKEHFTGSAIQQRENDIYKYIVDNYYIPPDVENVIVYESK